jgi:hypothetical protein
MAPPRALLAAVALGALATTSGCDPLECGPGTIEDNGVCVPADGQSPGVNSCGQGTRYDPVSESCVPIRPPTECGPNTEPVVNEDGVTVCEGSGGALSCSSAISCPAPAGGKVSVCGQLFDVERGTPIRVADPQFELCDPAKPTASGPCSLSVKFFDPLAFAAAPTSTPPQTTDELRIDDCGRFAGVNIARPFNGYLAIAVDDAGAADTRRLTGVAFAIEANERRIGVRAFSTAVASDRSWTTSAGNPFGDSTFADVGVFMPVYFDSAAAEGGTPVAGVQIRAGGNPADGVTTRDFYFSDTDPTVRSTINPALEVTSVDGAGLLTGSSLTQHSGAGSEPDGCEWPSNLAAAIPGVVFFREEQLQAAGATEFEPCPGI